MVGLAGAAFGSDGAETRGGLTDGAGGGGAESLKAGTGGRMRCLGGGAVGFGGGGGAIGLAA